MAALGANRCPECEAGSKVTQTYTIDGRPGQTFRRRVCREEGHSWVTVEAFDLQHAQVRKSNGVIAPYDRNKLKHSIFKAAPHRLTDRALERLVADIEYRLRVDFIKREHGMPVPVLTHRIEEETIKVLRAADATLHIRYCLVALHRRQHENRPASFENAREFLDWLRAHYQLEGRGSAGQKPGSWRARLATSKATPASSRDGGEADPSHGGLQPIHVVKRSGRIEPYDRGTLARGVGVAAKASRGSDEAEQQVQVKKFADDVADEVTRRLAWQPIVTSGQIGAEVLNVLAGERTSGGQGNLENELAFLRFASAFKAYDDPLHYGAEAEALAGRAQRGGATLASPIEPTPGPLDAG